MYIPSVLFSFLEAALKRWPRERLKLEIKQLMSTQLKTNLAVHGGGRTMVKKLLLGKRMLDFEFTVMRDADLTE